MTHLFVLGGHLICVGDVLAIGQYQPERQLPEQLLTLDPLRPQRPCDKPTSIMEIWMHQKQQLLTAGH